MFALVLFSIRIHLIKFIVEISMEEIDLIKKTKVIAIFVAFLHLFNINSVSASHKIKLL